jgi:predicted dehydrogenase
VIGAGYWGPKVLRNFAALPEARVTMVCDLVPRHLQAVGEQHPEVFLTADVAQLLASDVEAVAIATPVRTHFRLAEQALRAGKHVLVEKPLTANAREAAQLTLLAERLGLVLMTGHTFLFEPAVERLRTLVQSGELGEIWHVTSQRLNLGLFRSDVNVLWDLAPHDVSILLHVLGARPTCVSARGSGHVQPGIPEVAYVELQFPGNIMAHIHVSWLDPGKVRRLTVIGSQKMAIYDDTADPKLCVYDRAVVPIDAEGGPPELLYRYGETVPIALPPLPEPLERQCAAFLGHVRTRSYPRTDARLALEVVRVLEHADASLHEGGERQTLSSSAEAMSGCQPAARAHATV